MHHSVFRETFDQLAEILGSIRATLKLFILHQGIDIDGDCFAREIAGYPNAFRTKRARKRTIVQDGTLIDAETGTIPYIPEELFIELSAKPSVVKVNFVPSSPFKLILDHGHTTLVCEPLDLRLPVRLPPRAASSSLRYHDKPGDDFVQVIGADRIAILAYEGCAGWFHGTQCRFCDSCAARPTERSARPSLNDLHTHYSNNLERWTEYEFKPYIEAVAYIYEKILKSSPPPQPHQHLHVMAGNLDDVNAEWRLIFNLSEALAAVEALDHCDSYLNLIPPPDSILIDRAKELGFRKLQFNMEVYGERSYAVVCSDKHAKIAFPVFMDRLKHSVAIFGKGNVRCGFVFGAQPIEELCGGVQQLADLGVVTDYTVFTPKRGTPWEKKKRPPLHEVAAFSAFLYTIYMKYGYKPQYCALSSRSCIMNELMEE